MSDTGRITNVGRAFRLMCAVQVLVVALAGGVAVARHAGHGTPVRRTGLVGDPAATAGGSNEARAREEAAHLLSMTRVPDGAHSTARPPGNLPGPATGTPMVASLVIRTASWRLSMSYAAAQDWVKAHPPRDLVQSSSGSSGSSGEPDGFTVGFGYSDRPSSSWASADLEIGVAPEGDGSAIRADAVVVWLDPKPVRDATTGRHIHITVAGGCPKDDRGIAGVRNDDQRLSDRLLPADPPSRGLICRYDGLNGQPFRLRKAHRLSADQAGAVADAIRQLPLSHPDGGVRNCPNDDGAVVLVAFAYPRSGDVDVWIDASGCSYVRNGYIAADSGPVRNVIQRYG